MAHHDLDDLNAKKYLILYPGDEIPWAYINQEEGSEVASSNDGQYRLVELNDVREDAVSQEHIRLLKESDIDNWTIPIK